MRILHIASFLGNIGDNFNHVGTRKLLEEKVGKIQWSEIEIRETFRHRNNYTFDESFADYCNEFDAVIFGGGNFFELWVDHSANNTSANIPIHVIDKIHVPFYFYALGVDPGMGVTEEGIKKFIDWVEHVNAKENFHLSTRNDGAFDTLHRYFPKDFHKNFTHLVDGGFLVDTDELTAPNTEENSKYIGINIAGDMLDIRFNGEVSYEEFISKFAAFLGDILKKYEDYNILLIPHIFRDYKVVFDLLDAIGDTYRRERIDVSELFQGDLGMQKTVQSYDKCEMVLGNRFHSNVIGFMLRKKVFGLFNYRQIKDLYKEIEIENYFDITSSSDLSHLFSSIDKALSDPSFEIPKVSKEYLSQNRQKTLKFFEKLL